MCGEDELTAPQACSGDRMLKRLVIVAVLALYSIPRHDDRFSGGTNRMPAVLPAGQRAGSGQPEAPAKTRTICYSAFAVLHSGITRTPLWAAEHLTRNGLKAAVATERKDTFHEETQAAARRARGSR